MYDVGNKFIIEIGERYSTNNRSLDQMSPDYLYRIKGFRNTVFSDRELSELEPYDCDELLCQTAKRHEAEAYQKGLDAAWTAARTIISWWPETESEALLKRFGIDCKWGGFVLDAIFNKQNAQKAIESIEKYEKHKPDISIGDEIHAIADHSKGEHDTPNIVVTEIGDNYVRGFTATGEYIKFVNIGLEKTGRHFPQIMDIMATMKEKQ